MTSRFARLSDIIIQKLLRGLDRYELEPSGSTIDVINRAERRGLIDSAGCWRDLRELRNEIAHEYVADGLFNFRNGDLVWHGAHDGIGRRRIRGQHTGSTQGSSCVGSFVAGCRFLLRQNLSPISAHDAR